MVVIMAVFISKNLEFQFEGGKGMTGTWFYLINGGILGRDCGF